MTADVQRIVRRHMARILSNLEDTGCPEEYRNIVRAGMREISGLYYFEDDPEYMKEVMKKSSDLMYSLQCTHCSFSHKQSVQSVLDWMIDDLERETAGGNQ